MSQNLKKVFRIFEILILSVVVVFILLVGVVNLPFVHAFVTGKANAVFEKKGIPLHVGKVSLLINGKIGVSNVEIITPSADTIVFAGFASVDLKPMALFSKQLIINKITLSDAVANIATNETTGLLNIVSVFSSAENQESETESDTVSSAPAWEIKVGEVVLKNIRFSYSDKTGGILVEQQVKYAAIDFSNFSLLKKQIDIEEVKIESPAGKVTIWSQQNPEPEDIGGEMPAWKFSAKTFKIDDLNFVLGQPENYQEFSIALKKGTISLENLDLLKQEILVKEIDLSTPVISFSQEFKTENKTSGNAKIESFAIPFFDWTIKSEKIKISDGSFLYNSAAEGNATTNNWLPVRGINALFENTEITPSEYRLNLKDLSFKLANKLEIDNSSLHFTADSLQQLKLGLHVAAILNEKQAWLAKKTVITLNTQIEGNQLVLAIDELMLETSNGLDFVVDGMISDPLNFKEAGCNLKFASGAVTRKQLSVVTKFFSPTIVLPNFGSFELSGFVKNKLMYPAFGIKINSKVGLAEANGNFDINKFSGELQTAFSGIRLAEMFGKTMPEKLSGNLQFKGKINGNNLPDGQGFIKIDSVTYKNKTTQNILLKAESAKNTVDFELLSTDSMAKIDLAGQFKIGRNNQYQGNAAGVVAVDFFGLNLVTEPLAVSSSIDADFGYGPGKINASATLSDFRVSNKSDTAAIDKTNFSLNASATALNAVFDTGFLNAKLISKSSINSFAAAFKNFNPENIINLDSTNFLNTADFGQLEAFQLNASLVYDSIFNLFLPDSALSFDKISLNISKNDKNDIINGKVLTDRVIFNKIEFKKPLLLLQIDNGELAFKATVDSLTSADIHLGKTGASIDIFPSAIVGDLFISDKNDSILHQIGFRAVRNNNIVTVSSAMPYWTINRNQWQLKPPEFLSWNLLNKTISADLDLHYAESFIGLKGDSKGVVELNIKNLEPSKIAIPGIIDYLPEGTVDAYLRYSNNEADNIDFDLIVHQLKWNNIAFNLLKINGNIIADSTGIKSSRVNVTADESLNINAGLTSNNSDKTFLLKSDFQNLHFQIFEPFLTEYAKNLHGTSDGNISVSGNDGKINIDGELGFNDFGLNILALETSLTIPDNKIEIKNNEFLFQNFTVIDSLQRPLIVNGAITYKSPTDIQTRLNVTTDKITVMNTTPKDNSSFFGSIVINSGLTITGQIFNPVIKGNIELESGTNLTYQMIQDLSVEGNQTDVIFAGITDSLTVIYPNSAKAGKATKMPLIETTIRIDPKSLFNVKIEDIYNVDIAIGGEGLLTYNMQPNNTMSLNGIYEIKTGECKLKITGWPRKDFRITPGSSLRWNGNVENPELGIEATSKVKGSYHNPIDDKSRTVDFIVSMQVKNQLSELGISFDIKSEDQYITSVLNSLSDDDIMRQAVNLLLFETIDIPGFESSANYISSQINSFWESQLNALTSKSLKNTKLSFGIDTYNEKTAAGQQEKTSFTYEMEHKFLNDRATVKLSGKLNDYNEGAYQTNSIFENFIFEYALDSLNSKNLKLYQKRDYEDMLEGEVVKYGAGFLYRKNYHRLKDIWQREKKQKQQQK